MEKCSTDPDGNEETAVLNRCFQRQVLQIVCTFITDKSQGTVRHTTSFYALVLHSSVKTSVSSSNRPADSDESEGTALFSIRSARSPLSRKAPRAGHLSFFTAVWSMETGFRGLTTVYHRQITRGLLFLKPGQVNPCT